MPKKSRRTILMVTSEAFPFIKSGGLADVAGSLSLVLAERDNDVSLFMPLYGSIPASDLETAAEGLRIPTGFGDETCSVLKGRFPGSGVPVYFLKHGSFFSGRTGLYGSKEEPFFADNAKRFGFFSRAVMPLIDALGLSVDVVHAHDWQAALACVYMKADSRTEKRPAAVLSIHNIAYQGEFSPHSIHYLGLSPSWFKTSPDESLPNINFLRAGILHADTITTVSPTYAEEIRTQSLGAGLEEILNRRAEDLHGVLNGIDYGVWNPEADPALPLPFSEKDQSGKEEAKKHLRLKAGFEGPESRPLIGMVTRLAEQKGFPELLTGGNAALPRMLAELDADFFILGTGNHEYERALQELSARHGNLKAIIGFSEEMAHLIEGGSDFFLMPSRYEPCGLNQMYSLRYGTLPIVHRTGGLKDTVEAYDPETGSGTGFLFDRMEADEICKTVAVALKVYRERPEHIRKMRYAAMTKRFSWEDSAARYEAIYDALKAKG